MNETVSEYTCWRSIDYKPALSEISVAKLAPYLHVGQRALEVGCHSGRTAMWLANRGIDVLGVDINSKAIVQAQASAKLSNSKACFLEGDFLMQRNLGTFDFVLMIRVLTCFSGLEAWRALLAQVFACVAPGGSIYIHDFVLSPEYEIYRGRYAEGERQGWRMGNFAVPGREGGTLFIAHHHSIEEIREIMSPYDKTFLNVHDSLSLNGNVCRMFEFLGRRRPTL